MTLIGQLSGLLALRQRAVKHETLNVLTAATVYGVVLMGLILLVFLRFPSFATGELGISMSFAAIGFVLGTMAAYPMLHRVFQQAYDEVMVWISGSTLPQRLLDQEFIDEVLDLVRRRNFVAVLPPRTSEELLRFAATYWFEVVDVLGPIGAQHIQDVGQVQKLFWRSYPKYAPLLPPTRIKAFCDFFLEGSTP